MRYKRKPIFVDAFQMTEEAFDKRGIRGLWPPWLYKAWGNPPYQAGSVWLVNHPMIPPSGNNPGFPAEKFIRVGEATDAQRCPWGGYIVKTEYGTLQVMAPGEFKGLYELAEGEESK